MKDKDHAAKEKIESAKEQVVDAIAETMDLYSVTPAAGRLYATMQFEDQMNLDEMREELGMSKPSMSTSVRKLQEIDMVKKKFQRGSRKHTYVAEKNYFNTFTSYFCHMWDREAKMNLTAIQEAEFELDQLFEDEEVSEEMLQEARKVYHQIEDSKVYYRWLERLVASVRSQEIFKLVPKNPKSD
ncbi:MAG TPA: GbsR/MarR family transcriptional regulator [Virgibacillus sp.]|nr:GbsR/MarR family transcriptional regulator [Virgibacillus sp.]